MSTKQGSAGNQHGVVKLELGWWTVGIRLCCGLMVGSQKSIGQRKGETAGLDLELEKFPWLQGLRDRR